MKSVSAESLQLFQVRPWSTPSNYTERLNNQCGRISQKLRESSVKATYLFASYVTCYRYVDYLVIVNYNTLLFNDLND